MKYQGKLKQEIEILKYLQNRNISVIGQQFDISVFFSSIELDVGYIYNEPGQSYQRNAFQEVSFLFQQQCEHILLLFPGHSIMRKWLLLSDLDESTTGARGYMRVSIIVVGTGDDPPVQGQFF